MQTIDPHSNLSSKLESMLNRRNFLRRAGTIAAMTPLVGMLGGLPAFGDTSAPASVITPVSGTRDVTNEVDIEILNFALNLEYLEAEYYLFATTGEGLNTAGIATTGVGNKGLTQIKANPKVNFQDPLIQAYATEVAQDEKAHVAFLRSALGNNAIAQPQLDLQTSFNTLAKAAGIGSTFDPFANEVNFLLGAFIFEDVGVTAYHGAAPLINDKTILSYAAGILGTESYHASLVRTVLTYIDQQDPSLGISSTVTKISNLRDALDGPTDDDQGIVYGGQPNIVPTDANGLVYARTPQQILNIVYGAVNATAGLFFPNGVNETPLTFP